MPYGRWTRVRYETSRVAPQIIFWLDLTLSLDALDLDGGEENDLDLECVVCCELYDTSVHAPMVLPCSGAHEICRTCVAALRKADGAIQCPKCREDATGAVNPNRGLIAALRLSRRS